MSNKLKETDIENLAYYFFNVMINIKNLDRKKILMKICKKSYKNSLTYYIGYVTVKRFYITINSVISSYLIINEINEYIEKINGNEYLTIIPANESQSGGFGTGKVNALFNLINKRYETDKESFT